MDYRICLHISKQLANNSVVDTEFQFPLNNRLLQVKYKNKFTWMKGLQLGESQEDCLCVHDVQPRLDGNSCCLRTAADFAVSCFI
jgi:hypothetical protein